MEQIKVNDVENNEIESKPKIRLIWKLVFAGAVLVVALLVFLSTYFMNTVRSIKVIGNDFLTDEYIISLTDIKVGDRYFVLNNWLKKSKVTNDVKIDDCTITLNKHHEIVITVKENTIVGYWINEDESKFILADATIINFDSSYIKSITLIPLIMEYEEDFTRALATRLSLIKPEVLTHISDVSHISFTYEKNMVKLSMDEGYYVYSSLQGLQYVNYYLQIISQDTNVKKGCVLVFEDEEKAFIMDCNTLEGYRNDLD